MASIRPITPKEVVEYKKKAIPPEVFKAFNKLLIEKWNGNIATISQQEAIEQIREFLPQNNPFSLDWLNIEDAYRGVGWYVRYEKPGFNESGDAYFVFSTNTLTQR